MKKTYLIGGVLLLIFGCLISLYTLNSKNLKLQEDLNRAIANIKAYSVDKDSLKNQAKVYQFTTDQLLYYGDSLTQELDKVRKELKVKDKNLKQMQYLTSKATKSDTIVFRDTIFKETNFKVDTLIGDNWYTLKLCMKYPNELSVTPTFTSKKYIITSKKKETINPPKKFFLWRWFQKKHWVIEVNIKERNPHIKETDNKFIEIIGND